MVLTCMKQSSQVEQSFVAEATAGSNITAAMEGNRAETGHDTQALKEDQPSASKAGKQRDRPPQFQRSAQRSVQVSHLNLPVLANESILQVLRATQHDTQQGPRGKKLGEPGWRF